VFLLLGVEALVGWLLDHSDVQVTEFSDAETLSDEYSDEEVVEDVDDTPYPVVSSFHVSCLSYTMILLYYFFPSLKRTSELFYEIYPQFCQTHSKVTCFAAEIISFSPLKFLSVFK
jgi:hypothetical protein